METKVLEIRDEGTCIPAVAIRMVAANAIEDKFLWRCGYSRDGSGIVLMRLADQRATVDAYEWDGRTMRAAHVMIDRFWDDLKDGDVVDARIELGLADKPCAPEIWTRDDR